MSLDRCPWYIAGPLLGLLIVGLRAVLNKPFGALGGYVELAESARQPRQLGFRAFLLIGLVVGGALYTAPAAKHVIGSAVFGVGWSIAGTCPGPLAAMIGEGRLGGLPVAAGILSGVLLQRSFALGRSRDRAANELSGAAGM